jgi:hypothetical protein
VAQTRESISPDGLETPATEAEPRRPVPWALVVVAVMQGSISPALLETMVVARVTLG